MLRLTFTKSNPKCMDKWDRGLGVKQLANVLTPDVNRPLGRNVRNPTSSFAKGSVHQIDLFLIIIKRLKI